MPRGAGVADLADEVEIAIAALPGDKAWRGLQQERVARLEDDVAGLHPQPFAIPPHGDDNGVVARAKAGIADRPAHQRATIGDDRLDERPLRPGAVEREELIGRRPQTPELLQFHHRLDDPHEHQPVAILEALGGGHRREEMAAAVDLHEKQPFEAA